MRKQPVSCLIIGDLEHHEFVPAVNWLAQQVQLACFPTPSAVMAAATTCPAFELIVLAQARPGQYAADEVESLHRQWPLAKLVGLLGSWCEGEGRTGRPWPGVWRVHARDFPCRMRRLLEVSVARRSASSDHDAERRATLRSRSWLLPRLISEAERFYFDAAEPPMVGTGSILIATATREAFEPLEDAVRQAGYTATWYRSPSVPTSVHTAAIWDMARGDASEWQAARDFAQSMVPMPVLILVGFPRWDDFQQAATMSMAISGRRDRLVVLAKPLLFTDLCAQLAGITGATATRLAHDTAGSDHKDSQVITHVTEYY